MLWNIAFSPYMEFGSHPSSMFYGNRHLPHCRDSGFDPIPIAFILCKASWLQFLIFMHPFHFLRFRF